MLGYLLRRVLAAIPVMGVVALFVFLLLRLTPGDPAAIRRMLEVEEVADCIVFLASKRASGLTGESIAVDGGSTVGYY